MNFDEVMELAEDFRQKVLSTCPVVSADKVGLDARCGSLFIGDDFVASVSPRTLNYYGGFEYIDPEHVLQIGPVTVYSNESGRVAEVLSHV
jgi:hypothetical protein